MMGGTLKKRIHGLPRSQHGRDQFFILLFCLTSFLAAPSAQLLQGEEQMPCKNFEFVRQGSHDGDKVHTGPRSLLTDDLRALNPQLSQIHKAIEKLVAENDYAKLDYDSVKSAWEGLNPEFPLNQIATNEEWRKLKATILPGVRILFYFKKIAEFEDSLEVVLYRTTIGEAESMTEENYKKDANEEVTQMYTLPLFRTKYDKGQLVSSKLAHWTVDQRFRYFTSYDSKNLSVRTVDVNPAVQELESIYSAERGCTREELEAIAKVINRTDRVVIALLDLGLDYNHPSIAFRVPRISREILQGSQRAVRALNGRYQSAQSVEEKTILEKELQKLQRQMSIGWDFQDNDGLPFDFFTHGNNHSEVYDHGSHVGHIAAGNHDELAILPIAHPLGDAEKFYEAVQFAHDRGARVMNISLGHRSPEYFRGLDRAMNDFDDMLFVIAAGNETMDLEDPKNTAYPPLYTTTKNNRIIVAAHDKDGKLWSSTNHGRNHVDIAALGVDVLSFRANTGLKKETGTSMATPQVTRVAARIFHLRPELTPSEVKEVILATAAKLPDASEQNKIRTGGMLDEDAALASVRLLVQAEKTSLHAAIH